MTPARPAALLICGCSIHADRRTSCWPTHAAFLGCLTFELSRHRRWDARPGLAKMYRVPPDRAWWPAVGARLERGVRRLWSSTCSAFIYVGTINEMLVTFDPPKNARNVAERGIPLRLALRLEWSTALIGEDTRKNYGEKRFQALGFIGNRLHMLVFTPRPPALHVISLRWANDRERTKYAAQTQS